MTGQICAHLRKHIRRQSCLWEADLFRHEVITVNELFCLFVCFTALCSAFSFLMVTHLLSAIIPLKKAAIQRFHGWCLSLRKIRWRSTALNSCSSFFVFRTAQFPSFISMNLLQPTVIQKQKRYIVRYIRNVVAGKDLAHSEMLLSCHHDLGVSLLGFIFTFNEASFWVFGFVLFFSLSSQQQRAGLDNYLTINYSSY